MTFSAFSIAKLPYELISRISSDLEKNDILALRLTSKDISERFTPSFAERYLSSVRIIFTSYSLQSFKEICEHQVFAKYVHEIWISPSCIHEQSVEHAESDRPWFKYKDQESEDKARDEEKLIMDCYLDMQRLKNSKKTLDLFTHCFKSLKAHKHPLNIIVARKYIQNFIGFSKFPQGCRIASFRWKCCLETTTKMMIMAAFKNDCKINTFRIICHGPISPGGMRVLPGRSQGEEDDMPDFDPIALSVFSNTRNLELDLSSVAPQDTVVDLAKHVAAQATILETFTFSRSPYPRYNDTVSFEVVTCCETLMESCSSGSLKEIKFHDISFSQGALLRLLDRNKKTIHKLEIRDCLMYDGDWNHVITHVLKELPEVEDLSLGVLCETRQTRQREYDTRYWFHPLFSNYVFESMGGRTLHARLMNRRQVCRPIKHLLHPWLEMYVLDDPDTEQVDDEPVGLRFRSRDDVQKGLRILLDHHKPPSS